MKMNSMRVPLPVAGPTAALRGEAAPGYLTSSFELRSGLEVSAVALSQLPAEVMCELLRLQDSWGGPAQAQPGRLQAPEPSAASRSHAGGRSAQPQAFR